MSLLSCVLILGCRAHQAAFVLFDEPAITNLPVTGTGTRPSLLLV